MSFQSGAFQQPADGGNQTPMNKKGGVGSAYLLTDLIPLLFYVSIPGICAQIFGSELMKHSGFLKQRSLWNYFRTEYCTCLVLFLMTIMLFGGGVLAASSNGVSSPSVLINVTSTSTTSDVYQGNLPLMHFTKDQLDEMQTQIIESPKYTASQQIFALARNLPAGQNSPPSLTSLTGPKSLLLYLPYTPSQRDQGVCGDCWVWAATGALEIDHNVKSGINDRLSIQYFNSKYDGGQGSSWACCGGFLSTFTTWYNSDKTPIPWSNAKANFGDASTACGNYATAVPISSISTQPYYQMDSISESTIVTSGVGQFNAINNIKSALNSNKAVVYSFFLNSPGWTNFQNFWAYNSETSIFDPTPYNGTIESGGHAVLIVGYDDTTDPGNPYWLVLNSWGAPSNRPDDLFRLKMNLNYDAVYYSPNGGGPYMQHTFQILDSDFVPAYNAQMVSNTLPATMTAGQNRSVSITVKNTGTQSWSAASATALGTVNDTRGDGYTFLNTTRVSLPAGTTVASGQAYNFTFIMTAPSAAGIYNPQFQMVQNGVQWFGAILTTPAGVQVH
jgi:hypothetical protein